MKVILATGIYPPDIGGPATYVHNLARELFGRGVDVCVVTYTHRNAKCNMQNVKCNWPVISVSGTIPFLRWVLYAVALRKYAKDADVVYAFSSMSCGIPLILARLKKPKTILRLGGDFIWERYTAMGGMMGLREWYESVHWSVRISHRLVHRLLNSFDYIVFSTELQKDMYERFYQSIPKHCVIENALPDGRPLVHKKHDPFRLLFMGRFVGFKNLPVLLKAVSQLPHVRLTLVGAGPVCSKPGKVDQLVYCAPVYGIQEQYRLFSEHDLLIIPSITEISPNVALEARVAGLPVLLTEETGLSEELRQGMVVRKLRISEQIVQAILEMEQHYERFAKEAASSPHQRTWSDVCEEHLELFKRL